MGFYEKGDVRIHFEEVGSGFPLLVIAGGGLNSTIGNLTSNSPFNPMEEFKGEYRGIASDLRNAKDGQSSGPLEIDRPWDAYTDDHLGLMDHLGIDKFLVFGFCIGGPMIWNLLRRAPERIVAAVLAQPSGSRPEMRDLFYEGNMKNWGPELTARRTDITMEMVDKFLTRMYRTNPDFVFTVTRDFVRNCQTPVLILSALGQVDEGDDRDQHDGVAHVERPQHDHDPRRQQRRQDHERHAPAQDERQAADDRPDDPERRDLRSLARVSFENAKSWTRSRHVANAGERRARASIAPRILGREQAAVDPAKQRRRPPVPAAEQRHQRRDEQRPHHEGVDQHAGGRGDPDLLDERDGAGRERPDRHREQDRGRGHDAPRGGQAGGDRLALLARALALLADAPEQEHAVVRGQREDDRRRHQEVAGLHAAVRRVAQQALQAAVLVDQRQRRQRGADRQGVHDHGLDREHDRAGHEPQDQQGQPDQKHDGRRQPRADRRLLVDELGRVTAHPGVEGRRQGADLLHDALGDFPSALSKASDWAL